MRLLVVKLSVVACALADLFGWFAWLCAEVSMAAEELASIATLCRNDIRHALLSLQALTIAPNPVFLSLLRALLGMFQSMLTLGLLTHTHTHTR